MDNSIDKAMALAYDLGIEAGAGAAEWIAMDTFGGRCTSGCKEKAQAIIKMYDDGDPALYDGIQFPNLSGEWADSATPASLLEDIIHQLDLSEESENELNELLDDLCEQWELGASDGLANKLIDLAKSTIE